MNYMELMRYLKHNLFVISVILAILLILYIALAFKAIWLFLLLYVMLLVYRIFVLPAESEAESPKDLLGKIKNRIKTGKFKRSAKVELFDYSHYGYFIAVCLTGLCLQFYVEYINSKFIEINGIQDLFLISLTFILVYATLSLLSFTYTLVLGNVKRKEIIETDFENDIKLQHTIEMKINTELKNYKQKLRNESAIENEIKEKVKKEGITLKKSYHDGTTNNMIKINRKHQLKYKKAGQAFFMATLFSGLGFLFIYSYYIFSSIDLPTGSIYIPIRTFIISYGFIPLFNFVSLLLLSISVVNFLRGLIVAFKALTKEIPY